MRKLGLLMVSFLLLSSFLTACGNTNATSTDQTTTTVVTSSPTPKTPLTTTNSPTALITQLPQPTSPTPPPTATVVSTTPSTEQSIIFDYPKAGQNVTIPLHIYAQVGAVGSKVLAVLHWQDGGELKRSFDITIAINGKGLLIDSLDWGPIPQTPQHATQPATLELRNSTGKLLGSQQVIVFSENDPAVQPIQLFWVVNNEQVMSAPRYILKTVSIGKATLEELLWGPPFPTNIGFTSAIPSPQQVASFAGREPSWGMRVTLRKLTIENGVATADFSQELKAYGGGSLRVKLIRDQITKTLQQFPSVQQVRITIEGQSEGVLEP